MVGWLGLPQMLGTSSTPPQQAANPFVWGDAGAMLTPEELASQRAMAAEMMRSDYSPVQNIWQGLGRVADNWLGAIDARALEKKADAARSRGDIIAQALLEGRKGVAERALVDPYVPEGVRGLAGKIWERDNRKDAAPVLRDDNAGNTWQLNPATGEWKLSRVDPIPKMYIQGDQAIQVPNMYAPQQPIAAPMPRPQGKTDDDIWKEAHEAVRNGANAEDVFRRLQEWGLNP